MVRFKNRYLLVELVPVSPHKQTIIEYGVPFKDSPYAAVTATNVAAYLRQGIQVNFGTVGAASTAQSLSVKYCNGSTGLMIIRTARDHFQMVWAALTLLNAFPPVVQYGSEQKPAVSSSGWKCIWAVKHVSGTIRTAQKQAIKLNMRKLRNLVHSTSSEEEKQKLVQIEASMIKAIRSIEA